MYWLEIISLPCLISNCQYIRSRRFGTHLHKWHFWLRNIWTSFKNLKGHLKSIGNYIFVIFIVWNHFYERRNFNHIHSLLRCSMRSLCSLVSLSPFWEGVKSRRILYFCIVWRLFANYVFGPELKIFAMCSNPCVCHKRDQNTLKMDPYSEYISLSHIGAVWIIQRSPNSAACHVNKMQMLIEYRINQPNESCNQLIPNNNERWPIQLCFMQMS